MVATLMTSEFLKWTRSQTHYWIASIMDEAIEHGWNPKTGS